MRRCSMGAPIRIRAIRPDDQERLHEHFRGLSEKSVYFRFMGIRRDLSPEDLKRLTELDFKNHVGLAATLTENGRERFIGVGRYICGDRSESRRSRVRDSRRVPGPRYRHVAARASAASSPMRTASREFEADVLGENRQMLEVFAHSGFEERSIGFGRRASPIPRPARC